MIMYKQCKVTYEDGTDSVIWIESKYAKLNKLIFDEDAGKRCTVVEVYEDNVKTKEEIRKTERMFKSFMEHDGSYK